MVDLVLGLIVLALIAIPFYFQSRLASAPTRTERWLAFIWLWFRRTVCFLASAFFTACSALLTYDVMTGEVRVAALFGVLMLIGIAWMSAFWGIYGAGHNKTDFAGNERVHEQRKQRYGWRW